MFTTVDKFLTNNEIKAAIIAYAKCQNGLDKRRFVDVINQDIITPNLERINVALGQENDAKFLSYAIEHAIKEAFG